MKRKRVDRSDDGMDEPAPQRRLLGGTAADLPFIEGGAPISLDNLCRAWEEQPLDFKRPLVFFTVGRIAVLSSSSGVPETGSLCRQFWNWLGQPDPYRPDQIAFKMVDGRGIYMSLPNLTQFEVKLKHGPELESIIVLEPKIKGQSQELIAQTVMTSAYPPTAFRTCSWVGCSDQVLTYIKAEFKLPGETNVQSPELYIGGFYSKAADADAAPLIQEKTEEEILLRGTGRRLLCLMLDVVQWTHAVTLHASGLSHRDEVLLGARAAKMQEADIMQNIEGEMIKELRELNPHMFDQWKSKRQLNMAHIRKLRQVNTIQDQIPVDPVEQSEADEELDDLRAEWVIIRGNQNLVAYYMRTFGFKPREFNRFNFVAMGAPSEVILAHCNANAVKDGDCGEVIVSRERAASQIAELKARNCRNIRMLYLHDLTALSSVESLLPITNCLGLLGTTSMSSIGTIQALLTAHENLAVQIDCLRLDDSDWSWLAEFSESGDWSRLFIRSAIVLSFGDMAVVYDSSMEALEAKTEAIYHKVSGVVPLYMQSRNVRRAVRVKGEPLTDLGQRLYKNAEFQFDSNEPFV